MAELETLATCAGCGATVYPEHLTSRKAERISGQIFCVHCVRERVNSAQPATSVNGEGMPDGALPADGQPAAVPPLPAAERTPQDAPPAPVKRPQISFDRGPIARKSSFRRPLLTESSIATRCRVFHCRLNEAAVRTMEDQINEWIDGDDAICVKFMSSSIGAFDGKSQEPHLIVTVFY